MLLLKGIKLDKNCQNCWPKTIVKVVTFWRGSGSPNLLRLFLEKAVFVGVVDVQGLPDPAEHARVPVLDPDVSVKGRLLGMLGSICEAQNVKNSYDVVEGGVYIF